MVEKINAYSYLRISSDQQKLGDGIRRQMDASRIYAEKKGYHLVETLSDIGISAYKGKNASEGALGIFIEAINDGKIPSGSVLLVESLDRLSRQKVLEAFSQFTNILSKGIEIVTLTDEQHYTSESVNENVGQLFMSLGVMLRANEESKTKSKRVKAAWDRKRELVDRKKLTSRVPAWLYLSDDGTEILIDEPKAEIVRKIIQLSLNGMGTYSIAKTLNQDKETYPPITKNERWDYAYVKKILKWKALHGEFQSHERVDGKLVPCGDPIPDYFPALITEDEFNLIQSRLAERGGDSGKGRKGKLFTNIFTGMIKCGNCGGSLFLRRKAPAPKGYAFLRCSNSLQGNGCDAPAWRYDDFEASFMKFASELKFSTLLNEDQGEEENLDALKATALSDLAKSEAAFDTLLSQFEDPDLPEMVRTRLKVRSQELVAVIEDQKSTVKSIEQKLAERSANNIDSDQKNFLDAYEAIKNGDDADLRELRFSMHGLLKRTVREITIYNSMTVNPWEVPDALSERLIKAMGAKSDKDLEEYFAKPVGQRAFVESERYYTVRFQSGAERVVHPYENTTYMSVSERLAKWVGRV